MEILALAASALVLILLSRRNVAASKRADAALNVLLAKHAFLQLPTEERARVETRAREIMAQRGQTGEFQHEVERYGWYALAMKELEIAHHAKGTKGWKVVNDPSKAIAPGDPLLNSAAFLLKKRYGFDVSIG
ncbi:hypothetical protein SAMN06265795_103129 [Noviherbaspirillum humi]|uniref:Uncharacterized protein n=1 Tax=Noviherbaspirillum humi TaxID=1688639 RepID=A0A239F1S6_9BURK|nr:hypothetical protein [Noviherbaspirillum humi]SNS50777.1 hypothetical protein SAMN06265795_103129 [Noviherbaspirillum humi]